MMGVDADVPKSLDRGVRREKREYAEIFVLFGTLWRLRVKLKNH